MRTRNWLITFVLLAMLLLPAGLAAGVLVGQEWNAGSFTRWQRLPDPPAKPVRIVGGSTEVVDIEMAGGQVYYCNQSNNRCWVQSEEPVSVASSNEWCDQYPLHYSVSAPPGKVIDYLQTQWCHFEAGEEADYALLENGSVWMWNHWDANFLNLARAFAAMGGGCSVGLLISIAVPVFIWLRKRTRRAGQ